MSFFQEKISLTIPNITKKSVTPKVYQVCANISYKGFPHFVPDSQVFISRQKAIERMFSFLEEIKKCYSGIEVPVEMEIKEIDFID